MNYEQNRQSTQNYRHGPPVPQPDYRSPRPIEPQYQQAHRNSPKVSHQEVEINPAINLDGEDSSLFGDCVAGFITILSVFLIVLTFPFSLCACIKMVQEYERAVIFRLGKVKRGGAVGPGLFFFIPCIDQIVVRDLRTVSFDIPPQEILTKDSVTVSVDAVVYYRISSPLAAVCNVGNYASSTKLLASTT